MKKICDCGCKKYFHSDCFATCKECGHKWTGDVDRWWEKPCPRCKLG